MSIVEIDWAVRIAVDVQRSLEGGPYISADIERIAKALRSEREACAALAESFLDGKTDNISCIQANALGKVAFAIRNRK